jgi:hypothetical protein
MAGTEDAPSKAPAPAAASSLSAGGWWARAFEERAVASVGLVAFLAGTIPGLWPGAYRALTIVCLVVALLFLIQYVLRLRQQSNPLEWTVSGPAVIDLLAVLPVPLALLFGADGETARLFGVLWSLKLIRMNAAFALLGREP